MAISDLERADIFNDMDDAFTEIFETLENHDIESSSDEVLIQMKHDLERIYETIKENV